MCVCVCVRVHVHVCVAVDVGVGVSASEAGDSADSDTGTDYGATLSTLCMTCVSGGQAGSFGMDVDVLTELLMENGALSVVVEDSDYGTANERPIFDEPDGSDAESWFRRKSSSEGSSKKIWFSLVIFLSCFLFCYWSVSCSFPLSNPMSTHIHKHTIGAK